MTDMAPEIARFMAEELPADLSADEIWKRCAERFPSVSMQEFHRAIEIALEIGESAGTIIVSEIDEIKAEHFAAIAKREVILIVKHDYGYQVEHWHPDGVAPTSGYDTPQEAAARALQLLKLKESVTPQSWPEIAQIGGDGRSRPPRPR